ncbi:MAG: sirohydrochlorin cobaltochelatase [Desulfobacterales bacterium]|nr:sirohydrochlorin cobaltochelatase [Desulfobacterales bacterium]MBF0395327.1 sirohydrochlorin cobaltochelatase [Desulfobacterales bacterium]
MKNNIILAIILLLTIISNVDAKEHNIPTKKGILLVAFGSSIPKAQETFLQIDKKVKDTFPSIEVRWAYTSSIIREKLAKEGKKLDSVELALAKMMDDKFTHIVIQSLHTICGEEFHDLVQTINAFKSMPGSFNKILLGPPLLYNDEDMTNVSEAILKIIPKDRKKDDAVILMGHGTPHPSNTAYAALMYHLQKEDSNIYVATVEGTPTIYDVKDILIEKKITKSYLMPFMAVAGDHALNDMAGDNNESWKMILGKSNISCVPILKGTAEYEELLKIWINHLKDVFKKL